MTRQMTLLSALGVFLLLVLFYLFAWSPKSDELAEVRTEIDDAVAQQSLLESQIAALEGVRATAPEIEAALAAAESLVPRDAALPSALRQLQLAADDSGVELLSIAAGRPAADDIVPEVASISLAINAEGSYFQLVDFLRRIEDPAITPRVVLFANVSVSIVEYPTLGAALTGEMYALLPAPPVVEEPAPATPEPTEPDEPTEPATDEEAAA
jgi:Tfp pilus assembly protein PilO